jgi:hypothetical protein
MRAKSGGILADFAASRGGSWAVAAFRMPFDERRRPPAVTRLHMKYKEFVDFP